jgi:hypothetical protein
MKVMVPESVLVQNLDNESVLLNIDTEQYFGLDDVGSQMWDLLQTSESVENATEKLLEIYDAEKEQLYKDLLEFIEKLSEHGLLQIIKTRD